MNAIISLLCFFKRDAGFRGDFNKKSTNPRQDTGRNRYVRNSS